MPIQEQCRILDHQQLAPTYFKLILASDYISTHAEPGQFVQVKCSADYDPLLRRPLSIHSISPEHKTFELLYEVIGKGTELLAKLSVGSQIDILGPLGKGFIVDKNTKTAILIGGGMGVAPLLALASRLSSLVSRLFVLIGAATKSKILCEKEFQALGCEITVSTDDGSYGKKGLVSDVLLGVIENRSAILDPQSVIIYSCGPKAMLKAISEIAFQKQIPCQVSMEQRMACGIGTCLGCVIKTRDGYKKVCDDGPVFNVREVFFEP